MTTTATMPNLAKTIIGRTAIIMGVLTAAPLGTQPAHAACGPVLEIAFTESAPRDIFTLKNGSAAGWSVESVAIRLTGSAGSLLFDTQADGPGLDTYQPFRAGGGSAVLESQPLVADGDEELTLRFQRFAAGDTFTFTIDLDDRLESSSLGQTRISGSEIVGAAVAATFRPQGAGEAVAMVSAAGTFGADNIARISEGACS